jgi:low affinity Fe/Cu permease
MRPERPAARIANWISSAQTQATSSGSGKGTMARERLKSAAAATSDGEASKLASDKAVRKLLSNGRENGNDNTWPHFFSEMACATARFAGKPQAFLVAALLVVLWAVTGPLFGYSDTWQLVINTSTTIVTFLMVFLIQHTQNRDTLAIQLKLAELIISLKEAENKVATAEDLSEEDLEELHAIYRERAEETLQHLNQRRGGSLKRAS